MKETCGERSQVTESKFLLDFGVISYFQLLIFPPLNFMRHFPHKIFQIFFNFLFQE